MRIEALSLSSSPTGSRFPGKQYDLPDAEARALIAGGAAREIPQKATAPQPAQAEKTEAETYAETVTNPAPAKAERRGGRKG